MLLTAFMIFHLTQNKVYKVVAGVGLEGA